MSGDDSRRKRSYRERTRFQEERRRETAPVVSASGDRRTIILGLTLNNLTMVNAIDEIVARLKTGPPCMVTFVNANCVNIAFENPDYQRVLNRADYVFADGAGMKLASRCLGEPLCDNVNGTDLFPRLCEKLESTGGRVFLLGGGPGVAEKVRLWIGKNYPEVIVSGTHHGYFSPRDAEKITSAICDAKTDLLLVAMGTPLQELWIARNLGETGARVAIGVGGLFDFYSGEVRRAPAWVRKIDMEWMFRLCQEPRRLWRRYLLGNPVFLWRVLRARFLT